MKLIEIIRKVDARLNSLAREIMLPLGALYQRDFSTSY